MRTLCAIVILPEAVLSLIASGCDVPEAPSNSNLSGVDMTPRILGVNKNRQNSTESTENVSIPRRYWAISIHRVEWRFDPPKTEA